MTDFPTFQDLFDVGKTEILARNAALTRAIVEREGSDANALVAAAAAVGDESMAVQAQIEQSFFLGTAQREKLDRVIIDRYQLPRHSASPASVALAFTTATAAPAGFTIPARTSCVTSDGKIFVTLEDTPYPSGSVGPVMIAAQSQLAGASQQVKAGTITSITSSLTGAPSNLAVTNPQASFGAADDEEDDQYRLRGQKYYTVSKRGVLKAIELAALNVPGVVTANAFEPLDTTGYPTGIVNLVVADKFSEQLLNSGSSPVSYEQQSYVVAQRIQETLMEWRAGGIPVTITVANVQLLPVTLTLRFSAQVDAAATMMAARVAIVNYTNALPPGATWSVADAQAAIALVPGVITGTGAVAVPGGDVVPTATQVIRTYLGMVLVGASGVA